MSVRLIDNSDEFLSEAAKAKLMALEAIGLKAEGYAKKELTIFPAVDTGRLRNSITHAIKGDDVYIGTNVDYAKWVELGTGIYASDGTGRKTPWVYKDDEGEEHWTRGIRPVHFLKKAAFGHNEEYRAIADRIYRGK